MGGASACQGDRISRPPREAEDHPHPLQRAELLAGVPVHVVAARLGHADPSVMLRVYAHVIQELTPAGAATFAGAVEAAIQGDTEAGVSTGVSNLRQAGRRSISQNGSD